jgi:hypothetical protein
VGVGGGGVCVPSWMMCFSKVHRPMNAGGKHMYDVCCNAGGCCNSTAAIRLLWLLAASC